MKDGFRVVVMLIAACAAGSVAKGARKESDSKATDELKILDVVFAASQQIDSWVEVGMLDVLKDSRKQQAQALYEQAERNETNERRWEKTLWIVPHSELHDGEWISMHFGILLLVDVGGNSKRSGIATDNVGLRWDCRGAITLPSGETGVSCTVRPPVDVLAHILMERLRYAISADTEIQNFTGGSTNDVLTNGWESAWFDARNIYCHHSPGSNYFDLTNGEQVCADLK